MQAEEATARADDVIPARDIFVGRAQSLLVLERALKQSGVAGRSVVVSGEAGVGKTRLVEEFARRVEARAVHVARGHCYEMAGAPPYLPFQQAVESLRRAGATGLPRPFSSKGRQEQVPLSQQKGDPQGQREQFLIGVSEKILSVAASQPVLLVVEDIQWADIGSLLLLNILVDRGGPGLLVIATMRPEEYLEGPRRRLLYSLQSKSIRLDLHALARRELRELVTGLFSEGFVSRREVVFLHRLTGGNPLFARELLEHLRWEGALESDSIEQAVVRNRIPLRLADLLDLRLGALPAPVREVLSEASVLGDEFSLGVLSSVNQRSTPVIEDMLDVGIRRGIVRAVTSSFEPRFRFVHALFRRRLYESLRPSLRGAFHAKVARAAMAGDVKLSLEEQATHLALASQGVPRRKAIAACRRAATGSETTYAYETAAWFWELALQGASPRRPLERANLLARLGWARWAARDWQRAREAWKAAIGLYELLEEPEPVAPLALALGETARWQQDVQEADHWLRRALSLLPTMSEARVRALAMLGSVACLRSQPAEGMALLEEARRSSTSKADPHTLYWLSYGYLTIGEAEQAKVLAEDALRAAQQMRDHHVGGQIAGYLAQIHLSFLKFRSACDCVAFLRRTVEPSNLMSLSFLLISQSLVAAYRGDWKRVVRICDQIGGELRLGGRYQFAASRFFQAEANLALGRTQAACAEMSQALPDLEQMRPAAALHLARALLQLGELDEARRLVLSHGPALLHTQRMAAGKAILGEVAARLDEKHFTEQAYRLLLAERRPLLMLYSPVSVQRVLGVICTASGDWPNAIEHFDTAIEQLTRGGALGELVPTYENYAKMRRARRRRGDFTKALALELQAAELREKLGIPGAAATSRDESAKGYDGYGNRFALTGRELQVLALVAEGRRNAEIAEALGISDRTVERHLENITAKMGVGGRVEAAVRALEEGLLGGSHPRW
jgi:DNA-binding CsgD family transcriptional regulator/Tfp pilus assembly protein PilF